MNYNQLFYLLNDFELVGNLEEVAELKRGHINDTYTVGCLVNGNKNRYVAQKINKQVFRNVPELMSNICKITEHIKNKLNSEATSSDDCTLTVVPTKDGQSYLQDSNGSYWRVYKYIENTVSYDIAEGPEIAEEAGRACGKFLGYLSDIQPESLHETIPHFLDTPHRYNALDAAIEENSLDRVNAVKDEIEFAYGKREIADLITGALANGKIPLRATHNDTKLNNVLFNQESKKGVCIVDLDTCMPGSALYDWGDLVRNTTVLAAEDETDLSKVDLNNELYEATAKGFLQTAGKYLSKPEIDLMPIAPRLLALTLGIRFLTDYLLGDKYFKIHRRNHNLERCRTQYKVFSSMEAKEAFMREIIEGNIKGE